MISGAWARLEGILVRWRGRPALFALAVMNVITGLAMGVGNVGNTLGADSSLYRHCATVLAEGHTQFCGSLYSPLMAVAARPLTWLTPSIATLGMSLLSFGILLAGVARETRGQARVDRLLVALSVVTFAPVVYELLLGQTTVLIVAAIYPIARRTDAFRNGLPFGVVLALAPKPLLLPILIWMIVWRRLAFGAAVVTAVLLTGIGFLVLGYQQYVDWVHVLAGAGSSSIAGTFVLQMRDLGNSSLWPVTPASFVVGSFVVAATLWTIRTDVWRGFVASLLAGLLLAPYTMLYAYTMLVLAVRPALAFSPRATRALALTANIARLPATLGVWSVLALVACLPLARIRIPGMTSVEATPQENPST